MDILLTGMVTNIALIVAIGAQTLFLLRQALRGDRVLLSFVVCFLGDAALVLLGAAGMGVVAERAPWLITALTWAGIVYLLWFAAGSFRSAWRGGRSLTQAAAEAGDAETVAAVTGTLPVVPAPTGDDDAATGPGGTVRSGARAGGVGLKERTLTQQARTRPTRTRESAAERVAAPSSSSSVRRIVLLALSVTLLNPHAILDAMIMLGTLAQGYGEGRWLFTAGAILGSAVWFTVLGFGARALAPVFDTPRAWRIIDTVIGVAMLGIVAKLLLGM